MPAPRGSSTVIAATMPFEQDPGKWVLHTGSIRSRPTVVWHTTNGAQSGLPSGRTNLVRSDYDVLLDLRGRIDNRLAIVDS